MLRGEHPVTLQIMPQLKNSIEAFIMTKLILKSNNERIKDKLILNGLGIFRGVLSSPCHAINIDYFIESATYGFLFTSCKTLENERVSAANE